MTSMTGKVAIATGGATLLGQAIVRGFVREGAKVVIADIDAANGQALADELGDGATFVTTDITSDASIDACIETATKLFGGVDYLVNMASTYLDNGIGTSREDWLTSLNINLVGGQIFSQKIAPVMARRGGGAIVNFGSIAGKVSQPGRMTYSAAKAAILRITGNAAMQLQAQNIRVNSVSPGWTWSSIMKMATGDKREKADSVAAPFHMFGRTGNPEDVAEAVLFLCSEKARFITGTDIAVDGGYTAMGPEGMIDAVAKLME